METQSSKKRKLVREGGKLSKSRNIKAGEEGTTPTKPIKVESSRDRT